MVAALTVQMRELKFKAWDMVYKDMSVGFELDTRGLLSFHKTTGVTFEEIRHLPGRYILLQFTGLTDKNGKEIYEGDIVKKWNNTKPANDHSDGKSSAVHWSPANAGFNLRRPFLHKTLGVMTWEYEVIGNIYESPELLAN